MNILSQNQPKSKIKLTKPPPSTAIELIPSIKSSIQQHAYAQSIMRLHLTVHYCMSNICPFIHITIRH
jgi:hypothetical protein